MLLDALKDPLQTSYVRLKHVHETTISDIEFHPAMWGDKNPYCVYLCSDAQCTRPIHRARVDFEQVDFKHAELTVNSLNGGFKLLHLVPTVNEPDKLILLQIEETKK
jgi:hypothetical protein